LWQVPGLIAPLPPQVKARLLLQDLRPTYVKLGQIISSQGRALPLEWGSRGEVGPMVGRAVQLRALGAEGCDALVAAGVTSAGAWR
jgi:hypothetical protein